jgi:hypothetical protein
LTEESVSTYIDLLYSMFPYPQEERETLKGATENQHVQEDGKSSKKATKQQ